MKLLLSIHDTKGIYIDVCDEFIRTTGYKKDELIGKSSYDFFDVHSLRDISKSHLGEQYTTVDYEYIRKDGDKLKFRTHSYKLGDDIICVTHIITLCDKVKSAIEHILFPYS